MLDAKTRKGSSLQQDRGERLLSPEQLAEYLGIGRFLEGVGRHRIRLVIDDGVDQFLHVEEYGHSFRSPCWQGPLPASP
jgi:hypothetical protein